MKPVISIGNQDFQSIREKHSFYIDKTSFIKEWWENLDVVTLITRPRRFGKTLNMSMTEAFFLINTQAGKICSRTCPYGDIRNIRNCRENIRRFL